MAQKAIREMRDNPMNGATLYVRKDVQEARAGGDGKKRLSESWKRSSGGRAGSDDRLDGGYREILPTEWRRANDEDDGKQDQYDISEDELKEIEQLVKKRDMFRRKKDYKQSDTLREELKFEFGVHLDDRLKLWWTDTQSGAVPGLVSDIKGEGRWGKQKPWRQIPTSPESDALVDSDLVLRLLNKRDRARKMKDFDTADALLQQAHDAPKGDLGLRIHDESRTFRVWTAAAPPKQGQHRGDKLTPVEMCLQIVEENEPEKVDEIKSLLTKFPGREWSIFKRLKDRYK